MSSKYLPHLILSSLTNKGIENVVLVNELEISGFHNEAHNHFAIKI